MERKMITKIPDDFPLFEDWPEYKIQFMTDLASIIPETQEEPCEIVPTLPPEIVDTKIVVATSELYKHNESGRCYICNDVLSIEYSVGLEEWVYPNCELDGKHVIHDICMEYK